MLAARHDDDDIYIYIPVAIADVGDYFNVLSAFEPQSRHYIHFLTNTLRKVMNLFIPLDID